jgi:hypothetical protein
MSATLLGDDDDDMSALGTDQDQRRKYQGNLFCTSEVKRNVKSFEDTVNTLSRYSGQAHTLGLSSMIKERLLLHGRGDEEVLNVVRPG